jgi:hypothetical protein
MQEIDREPLFRIKARRIQDGLVLTEFMDNGHGLPEDNPDKILNAFVSTKENGMGIGLAISRSLVEAHEKSCGLRITRASAPLLVSCSRVPII